MRQRLMRPTAALFPLVGIAGVLAEIGTRDFVILVFLLYYLIQLAGVCAADRFRNAAACEPGVRRVDRRFGGALPPLAIGIVVAFAATRLLRPANSDDANHAEFLYHLAQRAAFSAGLISIEHLFEERMFVFGRRVDGVALSCANNGLLLVGVLLDVGNAEHTGSWFVGAAALGALISIAANYLIEPVHGFSLIPRNFSFAPRACLQTLLYPLAAGAALFFSLRATPNAQLHGNDFPPDGGILFAAACFGLISWRLARTTARRSADESWALNFLLIAFAAIPVIASAWLPAALPFAAAGALALVCAAAVFCAPGARLYAGIALTAAALSLHHLPYLGAPLAVAAILLNGKNAFRRKL